MTKLFPSDLEVLLSASLSHLMCGISGNDRFFVMAREALAYMRDPPSSDSSSGKVQGRFELDSFLIPPVLSVSALPC